MYYVYDEESHTNTMLVTQASSALQAGPSHAMNWYYPDGNTTVPAGPRGTNPNSMCGNAAMYDAVNGKILTLGGAPNYGVRMARVSFGLYERSGANTWDPRDRDHPDTPPQHGKPDWTFWSISPQSP